MKSDLDAYLEQAGVEGLVVLGGTVNNPALVYFTGRAHLGEAILARRRGAPPVLYCYSMEREEAARTGLRTEVLEWHSLMQEAADDTHEATALGLERALRENDLTGRVHICGTADAGVTLDIFHRLKRRLPSLEPVAFETTQSPLFRARATKDDAELQRIRRTGELTTEVVGWVADFLTTHAVKDGVLVNRDGQPLRIGDVRRRIQLWLAERDLENPEGTIFAIGHDAGVPHSIGRDDDPIPLGQPIVFDIFPCGAGGGYFYDFTRTWCLDHAGDELLRLHEDVSEAYHLAMQRARPGADCRQLQLAVCEFFEGRGHPTVLGHPGTTEGYVHSLGHGLGLAVHESPFFRMTQGSTDRLQAGHVVTIEPGLYYPDQNLGVRLEDTVVIHEDGPQVIAPYPLDLVLPMQGKRRGQASDPSKTKADRAG
jgi:Xaa-Pro aminopeptidase